MADNACLAPQRLARGGYVLYGCPIAIVFRYALLLAVIQERGVTIAVSGIYVTRGACLRYSPGMALIGYGRVSKRDQNPNAQRDLLTAAGCDELFIDKASGKLASRPQLDAAMRHLRAGDVLVITRLDRLGRSVKHLAALAVELQGRKIGLRVLQQGIDTTTAVGRLFFHILAAIAEFERELIIERTVDGLDATRARGRKGGRKPTLTEAAVHQAQAMYDSGQYTVEQIAAAFKTTRPTIYRALDPDTVGKRSTSPAKTRRAVASMVDSGTQPDDGL